MSTKVVSISADDNLRIVNEIMELGRVRHLPVVRRGTLVGVVSQRDLLHASLSNVMGVASEDQKFFLQGVTIDQVMSEPAISVAPSASIQEAARAMAEHKIGCLPVVEGGKVRGIVTETDVLRHFAGMPPEFEEQPGVTTFKPRSPSSPDAGDA
jgi:CBS domain-containing protein